MNSPEFLFLDVAPGTGFHFGKSGLDENSCLVDSDPICRSDTFYSALIDVTARAQGNVDLLIRTLYQIKLSSAFPCLSSNAIKTPFLPAPATLTSALYKQDLVHDIGHKRIKKLRYISTGLFAKGANPFDKEHAMVVQDTYALLRSEWEALGLSEHSETILYPECITPKVKVHTETDEGGFYFESRVETTILNRDILTGWHVLIEGRNQLNEEENAAFEMSLQLLCEAGLGGNRSTGNGIIKGYSFSSIQLQVQNQEEQWLVCGLLLPNNQQEFDECLGYQLVHRGGRPVREYGTDERLLQILLLAEGAVTRSKPVGRVVNIAREHMPHPYYRFGTPVSLPLPSFFHL